MSLILDMNCNDKVIYLIPTDKSKIIRIKYFGLTNEPYSGFDQPQISIAIDAPQNILILRENVVSRSGGIDKVIEQFSNGNGKTKSIRIMRGIRNLYYSLFEK